MNIDDAIEVLYDRVWSWDQSVVELIGKRIFEISKKTPQTVWEIDKRALMRRDLDKITHDLSAVTTKNAADIAKIYKSELKQAHAGSAYLYRYRGKKYVPYDDSESLKAMARAYARETAGQMVNLSSVSGIGFTQKIAGRYRFFPIEDFYMRTLDKAVFEVANGSQDFYGAMRDSIRAMGGGGVRVNYGSGYSRRLDSAVRQAMLYGTKLAHNEYQKMVGEELGCDGIEIDWHSDPRPSHEFMQGKQYSTDGNKIIDGVFYEDAAAAGVYTALNDYGCRHFATPIICGVSEPAISPAELKRLNAETNREIEIDGIKKTGYGWSQTMRRLETRIRELEEEQAAFGSAGDTDEARKIGISLARAKEKYKEIANAAGIKEDKNRIEYISA